MARYITIPVILLCSVANLKAQDAVNADGFAQIRLEDHMSKEEAREEARQQAKINAIESVFGAYVQRDSDVDIEDGKTSFRIIGQTRVRGDWLKTISEKFGEEKQKLRGRGRKDTETWISCSIKGKIREIGQPETALEYIPLNCPELICRSYDFKDGEPLYLSFRTPVDGYLSIFIKDGKGTVYRLLPYQKMSDPYRNSVPVKGDFPYMFFLNGEEFDYFPGFSYMMTDEIVMRAELPEEFLDLFLVFSTSDYSKPLLDPGEIEENSSQIPRSLDPENFSDWLGDNRIHDPAFQYNRITLTIKK